MNVGRLDGNYYQFEFFINIFIYINLYLCSFIIQPLFLTSPPLYSQIFGCGQIRPVPGWLIKDEGDPNSVNRQSIGFFFAYYRSTMDNNWQKERERGKRKRDVCMYNHYSDYLVFGFPSLPIVVHR
jgi:hypothetical protein